MKHILSAFLFFAFLSPVSSQGWERFYGEPDKSEEATGIALTPDGGLLVTIEGDFGEDGQLKKISLNGEEEWSKNLQKAYTPLILKSSTGGYFISGTRNTADEALIMEVDGYGNSIWEKTFAAPSQNWVALPDGFVNYFTFLNDQVSLSKVNLSGDSVWEKTDTIIGMISGNSITTTLDEGFAIASLTDGFTLAKFNGDGTYEIILQSFSAVETASTKIVQTADSSYVIAFFSGVDGILSLNKISPTGGYIWGAHLDPSIYPEYYTANSIIETSDGSILIAGQTAWSDDRAFLAKFSSDGDLVFLKHYHGSVFNHVIETQNGNYCAVGATAPTFNNGDAYIVMTDTLGNLFPNAVTGAIALDENENCSIDSQEFSLEGWTVEANGLFTEYTLTDTAGNYFIPLDTGEYTLSIIPPNDLWAPCESPLGITLSLGDTLTNDFPVQAAIECPAMQVDISRPFLRRCFDNQFVVEYCNLGTVMAEDATIEVTLDSLIEFVSSTLPVTNQTGNVFTFELGDVDILECGSFQITALVSCDAVLGQSLCFEAHIFPDTICGMPFNFSGASMEARAKCEGDTSVILELENVGTVPTSEALEYIVIEDQIIFLEGEQVFNPSEVLTFTEMANGSTWRVISEQEPNHPGNPFPTAFVEGCGDNELGTFSIGFANEHPLADGDGFIDIDCEEVVGAYDPNDKSGMPIGYGEENFIEPNTDLEYRIRFQNTGTDTAFNVVIRDTLSSSLDPTSLRPGAASHAYEFDLTGNGVAVFTFPDIMLPDSNVNEPLSHGFVTFKISQMPDLEPETVITNSAAIYFDFNAPIITNETFHTIERDFIISAIFEKRVENRQVKVYPNPFADQAIFEVENIEGKKLSLQLFDSMGRLVRTENFEGNRLVFQRGNLRDGIWFFQIEVEGLGVASGKLVIVKK